MKINNNKIEMFYINISIRNLSSVVVDYDFCSYHSLVSRRKVDRLARSTKFTIFGAILKSRTINILGAILRTGYYRGTLQ